VIRGERITFYVDEERSVVEGARGSGKHEHYPPQKEEGKKENQKRENRKKVTKEGNKGRRKEIANG